GGADAGAGPPRRAPPRPRVRRRRAWSGRARTSRGARPAGAPPGSRPRRPALRRPRLSRPARAARLWGRAGVPRRSPRCRWCAPEGSKAERRPLRYYGTVHRPPGDSLGVAPGEHLPGELAVRGGPHGVGGVGRDGLTGDRRLREADGPADDRVVHVVVERLDD